MKTIPALFVLLALLLSLAPVTAQTEDIRFPLPEEIIPIEAGQTMEGSLEGENQALAYGFEGQEGEAISAYVLADTDDVSYSIHMYLLDEDDKLLMMERVSFINLDYESYIPLYVLPDTGSYKLIVTSSDNAIFGEADVTLDFTLTFETPDFETLTLGETVIRTVEKVEGTDYAATRFYLEGNRAELPYFIFETEGRLELTVEPLSTSDPDTFQPNKASDGAAYLGPLFNSRREQYAITVSGFIPSDEPVEFTLTVENFEPAALASGETVAVEISVETLRNYAQFEAEAGDEATITLSANEAINPAVVLFDPVGRVAGFDDTGAGLEELELLEDGTYVIMVFPQTSFMIEADQLGEVEITLELQ